MKKPKITVDAQEANIGSAQEKLAIQIAGMLDRTVSPIVTELASHKREYQGGPFVVMDNVINILSKTTVKDSAGNNVPFDLESLPDPKSKAGNNPAHYKVKVPSAKGMIYKEKYFYDELALNLPSVIALDKRRDTLTRSMAKDKSKIKTDDITPDIERLPVHTRMAEVSRLSQQIAVAKSNVSKAFELYHQLMKFSELDTVTVTIVFALGPDGKPQDGEDGRPMVVEKINSPIIVRSTVKGREFEDYGQYSIGSFLRFDIKKAKEAIGGPTFHALQSTLSREPEPTPQGQVAINTLETYVTRLNDQSEYLHRLLESNDKAGWETLKKLASSDTTEGKDFLYNISYLVNNLRPIADDPRNQIVYQSIINEGAKKQNDIRKSNEALKNYKGAA